MQQEHSSASSSSCLSSNNINNNNNNNRATASPPRVMANTQTNANSLAEQIRSLSQAVWAAPTPSSTSTTSSSSPTAVVGGTPPTRQRLGQRASSVLSAASSSFDDVSATCRSCQREFTTFTRRRRVCAVCRLAFCKSCMTSHNMNSQGGDVLDAASRTRSDLVCAKCARYSGTVWHADAEAMHCGGCSAVFSWYVRRHHCRQCGHVFCHACCPKRLLAGGQRYRRLCSACADICTAIALPPPPSVTPPRAASGAAATNEYSLAVLGGRDLLDSFSSGATAADDADLANMPSTPTNLVLCDVSEDEEYDVAVANNNNNSNAQPTPPPPRTVGQSSAPTTPLNVLGLLQGLTRGGGGGASGNKSDNDDDDVANEFTLDGEGGGHSPRSAGTLHRHNYIHTALWAPHDIATVAATADAIAQRVRARTLSTLVQQQLKATNSNNHSKKTSSSVATDSTAAVSSPNTKSHRSSKTKTTAARLVDE
eukprot:PhM_4_TR13179/c0_g1_i1/m.7553